ncbi:MAG TPA: glycosyltransferase family 4 protein [Candidatus Limnocylindrales bacterium]|nr:glycosyltransferase family 4 protein [Candidatus Limnocylindrales bacterium]
MKIGLVTPYIYPLPGGVNDHVHHLYQELRERGHTVRIVTASHGLQPSQDGDVIRIGKGISVPSNGSMGNITVSPRFNSQVRTLLDAERFDLLHFHEPFVPFLSLVLLDQSRSVNVATFHAYAGWSLAYQFGRRVLGHYGRRLHGRIAVSAAARHFADRYFPGDYKVIPNGVDISRFEAAEPIERWRDGIRNIFFVGRLENRKGVMDLLKAYRLLRKAGCECRLLLAGAGPLEKQVRRYLLTRRTGGVELLGRISDTEKARLFATADVFVAPATGRESFGIVLLEAMAAGKPIVASDIHGYRSVVRRGEQGLLVPPQNPRALAGALARLLSDDALRERMGASGRERVRQFSWESVTAKVEAYYEFVIRRLATQGALPPDYRAPVPPPAPRPERHTVGVPT